MALNKPSSFLVSWHPESPITDVEKLKLMLMKIFTNVVSIEVKGKRVVVNTTYTSSTKNIEKKLEPFHGNIRWNRAGPLTTEQEEEVDDLFNLLGNKRKAVDHNKDEEQAGHENRKFKPRVAKRHKPNAPVINDESDSTIESE